MDNERLENALAWGRKRMVERLLTMPHMRAATAVRYAKDHEYQYISKPVEKIKKNACEFGEKNPPGHPLSYDNPPPPTPPQKESQNFGSRKIKEG
jgi:hypothetical protein